MHIVLKVLASTSIKRRKPWPRIAWIGEGKETLLLLGNRRISVLYIKSGKTKRKVPSLQAFIKDCVSINYSSNGHFFVGLLSSRKIILWHKDSDHILLVDSDPCLTIRPHAEAKHKSKVYVSDDGQKILLVTVCSSGLDIYLWQCNENVEYLTAKRQTDITGSWWHLNCLNQSPPASKPTISDKDFALDVCFMMDYVLGNRAMCGFVFTRGSCIHLLNLNIVWSSNSTIPVYHWQTMKCPLTRLASDCQPTKRKGAHVLRWSHDGRLIALATNQESGEFDKIVFLSPHCDVLLVANFPRESCSRRHHRWIYDMAWTYDDLFIVSINNLGSICLLSRLGEPLTISTRGCSVDLPAAQSLNIHPYIYVRPSLRVGEEDTSLSTDADVFKQRFSVCCHPRLPVFICSDGYMVTYLQLPQCLADPLNFIHTISQQAHKYTHLLFKLLKHPEDSLEYKTQVTPLASSYYKSSTMKLNHFEVLSETEFTSRDVMQHSDGEQQSSKSDSTSHLLSENLVHRISTVGTHDSGTLIFGTQTKEDQLTSYSDNCSIEEVVAVVRKEVSVCILRIWGILVTYSGPWTIEWEAEAKNAAALLVKLCSRLIILVDKNMLKYSTYFKQMSSLVTNWLSTCQFNALDNNVMVITLSTIKELLQVLRVRIARLPKSQRIKQSFALYRFLEEMEKGISWSFGQNIEQLLCISNYYSLSNYSEPHFAMLLTLKNCGQNSLIKHRLITVWKIFYKDILEMYKTYFDEEIAILLGDTQRKCQEVGYRIKSHERHLCIKAEERMLICSPEKYKVVIELWKKRTEKALKGHDRKSVGDSSHYFLAMLYVLLGSYHIQESIALICWLIMRNRNNNGIKTLQHPAINTGLKSFARFMTRYFTNEELFVYSFLCPRHLPKLHHCHSQKNHIRKLRLCHQTLTRNLSNHEVAKHWNPDVAVALFLMCGSPEEASNLAHHLGDWKTSMVLLYASQACSEQRKRRKIKEKLQTLLSTQLCSMLDSICSVGDNGDYSTQDVTIILKDWLLAGAFCDVDVLPTVFSHLIRKLHLMIRHLPLFVSPNIHLPYPPPYGLELNEQENVPVDTEESYRIRITRTVRLFVTILRVINCEVPVIHSYLAFLQDIYSKTSSLKDRFVNVNWPLENVDNKLKDHLSGQQDSKLDNKQIRSLVPYFRDLCTICWFMYTRDKFNRRLRKLWVKKRNNSNATQPDKFYCKALNWASHLIPFSVENDWGLDVYHLIVSILVDAPQDRRASLVLANCFPEDAVIPADIDYRMQRLGISWRRKRVKMLNHRKQPKNNDETLFDTYQRQRKRAQTTQQRLKETFGEFEPVSQLSSCPPSQSHKVKSFEIEKDYLDFLALMLDVGIIKGHLEDEPHDIRIPILSEFRCQLAKVHHKIFVSTDISDERKKFALCRINLDAEHLQPSLLQEQLSPIDVKIRPRLAKRKLFRSSSLDEMQAESRLYRWSLPLRNVTLKAEKRAQSLTVLTKDLSAAIHSKSSSLLYLCEAVDVESSSFKLRDNKTDEEVVKTFAWLLKWARKEHKVEILLGNPRTSTTKLHLTLCQLLWAVRQRKMLRDASQELKTTQSQSDICENLPDYTIEDSSQRDSPICRRRQTKKSVKQHRQGMNFYEDSTDFHNWKQLEKNLMSNWILKTRQNSEEGSGSIPDISYLDRSVEELKVDVSKTSLRLQSTEDFISATKWKGGECSNPELIKCDSHGPRDVIMRKPKLVPDAQQFVENTVPENQRNGMHILNPRLSSRRDESPRGSITSLKEDASVRTITTSKWTDSSQSFTIPSVVDVKNNFTESISKNTEDNEISELDSTLISISSNDLGSKEAQNLTVKHIGVQVNEDTKSGATIEGRADYRSVVQVNSNEIITSAVKQKTVDESGPVTWTPGTRIETSAQTDSLREQKVSSDKADELELHRFKFLRLPAEKELSTTSKPSTKLQLENNQPVITINEQSVRQTRIPALLKLDEDPKVNRVSFNRLKTNQVHHKWLTHEQVLDIKAKWNVKKESDMNDQPQEKTTRQMIPPLLQYWSRARIKRTTEKSEDVDVGAAEIRPPTNLAPQLRRSKAVKGRKEKTEIIPLTECSSSQTDKAIHNDVSTLTDDRKVRDTATETCLDSPKIMVSFGVNTAIQESNDHNTNRPEEKVNREKINVLSSGITLACGTQTEISHEGIQTKDVGTNPDVPQDSIYGPSLNKVLTNGSIPKEHPVSPVENTDFESEKVEGDKGFNIQELKDRMQFLANEGFLDLVSSDLFCKQKNINKKTRFANDIQPQNAAVESMVTPSDSDRREHSENTHSPDTMKSQGDKRNDELRHDFTLRKQMALKLLQELRDKEIADVSQQPSGPIVRISPTKVPQSNSSATKSLRYQSYPTRAHIFRGEPQRNPRSPHLSSRTMLRLDPTTLTTLPKSSRNGLIQQQQDIGNTSVTRCPQKIINPSKLSENNSKLTNDIESNHPSRSSSSETLSSWSVPSEVKKLIYGEELHQQGGDIVLDEAVDNTDATSSFEKMDSDIDL